MHDTILERRRTGRIVKIFLWAALALVSLTVVRRYLVSVTTYQGIIQSLDSKQETAFGLIAASTAISAAITLLPGDVASPIAQQIAELSEYFIVVLGALYLEKYLLTILGFVSSVILVPGSCALNVAHEIHPGNGWKKRLATLLLVVGAACVLVIPASVAVSNSIDHTFHDSIQGSIDAALEVSGQIASEAEEESSAGLWDTLTGAAQAVKGGISSTLQTAREAIQHMIESITIMLVTDCVIPIAVVVFFVWLVKTLVKALYAAPPERRHDERRWEDE